MYWYFFNSKKSVSDVQAKGRVCVLDIDIQGVHSIKDTELNPIYVFVQPPSEKELVRLCVYVHVWERERKRERDRDYWFSIGKETKKS